YIRPICLPHLKVTRPKVDQELEVAGWGWKRKELNFRAIETKQKINIKTDSDESCNANEAKLQQNQACGNYSTSDDVCLYEDGGPLVFVYKHRWYQEGIALSREKSCLSFSRILVYVKVADYLDWINENMGKPTSTY
ncbi:hypothetical protein ILUMI_15649, partial [Ignelater luminosus]